jgi:hypothetical protein
VPKKAFRRAWDVHIILSGIKVGSHADLMQIIPAHDILALFPHFPQYRHQYSHQQRNNGNHHQQFYQREPLSFVHGYTPAFIAAGIERWLWTVVLACRVT